MNKYAVAVISFFDNENTVQIVDAENEIEAVKRAVITFNTRLSKDNSNKEIVEENENWLNITNSSLDILLLDTLLEELFNGELGVSKPIQI